MNAPAKPSTQMALPAPRLYGTVRLKGRSWAITAEPHVMGRLRRLFTRISKAEQGTVHLSATPENTRELRWFIGRYPMAVEGRAEMERLAAEHIAAEAMVARIVADDYVPPALNLAIPPRDYQRIAAHLLLRTGRLLLADDVGLGKQHPVDTKVLTPVGYRRIGDLRVGDEVIGSDGRATRVTGIFPQGVRQSYRVSFSDGASVEAGPEHLWTVAYWRGGRSLTEVVVTTEQIRTGAMVGRMSLARTKLILPMLSGPVVFDEQGPLPLDPYLVGQLLANGALTSSPAALTTNTTDWPEIRARLSRNGVTIGSVHAYGNATRASILGVQPHLRQLGMAVLSGKKAIPDVYMRARVEDRIALLQGLMDGDGSCSATGNRVVYHTTSPRLAEDVMDLVEQLGGIASVRAYDRSDEGKPTDHQVRVRLPLSILPFSTTRKASRLTSLRRPPVRKFARIDYVRDVESVCIRVDAPDALYATEHCILTHNTCSAIATFSDPRTLPALVVTLTHLPRQWAAEIGRFAPNLKVHIAKGTTPYDLCAGPRGTRVPHPDVIVLNYHKLAGWAEALAPVVNSVVFDECQELRVPKSQKYSAATHVADRTAFRMGLSATPIYNQGGELYHVLRALAPEALGTFAEFTREWCGREADTADGKAPGVRNPEAFGRYLRDQGLMLRRTRADVSRELPDLMRSVQVVDTDAKPLDDVSARARELAEIILAQGGYHPKVKLEASEELSWRLRQATGIAKAESVAAFVRVLVESGERVLLYGWHKAVYDIWRAKLAKLAWTPPGSDAEVFADPVFFTGEESESQKAAAKAAFVEGRSPVLIMSLRAGAGVDGLQHICRTVVFGELDWSPGVHEQASGRVHRDGQKDPVMVYYLVSDGGSDPTVMDVIGVKKAQSDGVRDPNGALVAKLDRSGDHIKKLAATYLAQRRRA